MEEENKELMNTTNNTEENDAESSGIGTGVAIAIGSALTLAVIGGVKFVKNKIVKLKASRAESGVVVEDVFEDVFEEEEETENEEQK